MTYSRRNPCIVPALSILALAALAMLLPDTAVAVEPMFADASGFATPPWWGWVVALFFVTFALGIVSVLAGVGGGVLFVPVVGAFFPFHLDFVRATGLFLALSTALAASPRFLRSGLISMRLAMPQALVASAFSIVGACLGFSLPVRAVQILLGVIILCVVALMLVARRAEYPLVPSQDALARFLGMKGSYREETTGTTVEWQTHRTPLAFLAFILVGTIGGMFGMGAGWASVPVLNLLMGAPLKVAVATSTFMLSTTGTSAAWVYIYKGTVLPAMVAPCILGVSLGSRVGARLLGRTKPSAIRWIVIVLLFIAGSRSLVRGIWP